MAMSSAVVKPRAVPPALDAADAPSLRELNDLLALIYRGPQESPPWHGLCESLRQRLGASYVFFILRPPSAEEHGMQVVASGGVPVLEAPGFYDGGYLLDPFVNLPSNCVVTVDDIVGASAWVDGAFYRQFMPADGSLRYIMGADLYTEEGIESRLRVGRPASSTNFSRADKSLCQMLLPHLACSMRFHARLNSIELERNLFASTIDRMQVGTLIFDDRGALIRTNSVAQAILNDKDGIELTRGTLHATYSREENRELQRLLGAAFEGVSQAKPNVMEAVSITRPSGRQKLGVMVRAIPISEWSEGQRRPAVAVFIRDPDQRAVCSQEIARRLFNLTLAESAVASLLANGLCLEDASDELHICKNTARAHLRSIFSKIGVTSQSALVRVLLNSVMYLQ
jgi:DNA-binding CsgD family transcriptional regulator